MNDEKVRSFFQAIESRLDYRIPDELIQFYLDNNDPNVIIDQQYELEELDESEEIGSFIESFFPLFEAGEVRETVFEDPYAKEIFGLTSKVLAFAADHHGNLICIGLDEQNRGRVLFVDHENNEATPESSGLIEIASSIEALLKDPERAYDLSITN